METSQNSVIFYHAYCNDGLNAMLVLKTSLKLRYPNSKVKTTAISYPKQGEYTDAENHDIKMDSLGCVVYIVDFSFPVKTLNMLLEEGLKIFLIDHHPLPEEKLKAYDELVRKHIPLFDFIHDDRHEKCGTKLTWEYVCARHDTQNEVPSVIDYINDWDLQLGKFPQSRHFAQGLRLSKEYNDQFSEAVAQYLRLGHSPKFEMLAHDILSLGQSCEIVQNNLFRSIMMSVSVSTCKETGLTLSLVNIHPSLVTDFYIYLKDHSLKPFDYMVAYSYSNTRDELKVSFRGPSEPQTKWMIKGKPFTSALFSELYSGGGHNGASSFIIGADNPAPSFKDPTNWFHHAITTNLVKVAE